MIRQVYCGAACLATISKQYGLKIPISKIRETAGTDKHGTSAYGLIKVAEKLGFTAKGVKANKPEDIFSEIPDINVKFMLKIKI
ncbi:cysteine peptidase family C39 domain-containing protein [Aceticella autotrophica]|uniref:cysteine peptidase family C39 domain-containing protein n=1 Tax=Aceticella autotrophica TaxID=2755338 RepID=UPI003D6E0968